MSTAVSQSVCRYQAPADAFCHSLALSYRQKEYSLPLELWYTNKPVAEPQYRADTQQAADTTQWADTIDCNVM